MIKNSHKLEKFYRDLEKNEHLSLKKVFRIYDMLHKEAISLGAITSENIMDGFEITLRVARAINGLKS
jgi:hypothetical protein